MPSLTPIKLGLSERIAKDKSFRNRFFRGQAQDEIAMSIVSLRKLRAKRQIDLATEAGMKQSAISRIEQANYSKWSLTTLWRVAEALDSRLRVTFEPVEGVIEHYKEKERELENQQREQTVGVHEAMALRSDIQADELSTKVSDEGTVLPVSSYA